MPRLPKYSLFVTVLVLLKAGFTQTNQGQSTECTLSWPDKVNCTVTTPNDPSGSGAPCCEWFWSPLPQVARTQSELLLLLVLCKCSPCPLADPGHVSTSSLEGLRSELGHDESCFAAKMKHLFASRPGTALTKDSGRPGVVKSARRKRGTFRVEQNIAIVTLLTHWQGRSNTYIYIYIYIYIYVYMYMYMYASGPSISTVTTSTV